MRTTAEIAAWREANPEQRLDLRGANLRGADLSRDYLRGANLHGADLRGTHLRGADLSGANLTGAYLIEANLVGADLSGAHLREANLRGANLRGANLSGAYLSGAYLVGADLSGADLREANLIGANLRGADLYKATGIERLNMIDPRGYVPVAQHIDGQVIITSDCRRFAADDALVHWGESYQGERRIGDRYLRAIRQYLEEKH